MTVNHGIRGVHVSSGEGIVAHLANLTAFANGEETRLNELLVRLNALAGAPWHEIVRTLTASISEADFEAHPDLACVSIEDDRVAALVFGGTALSITIEGSEMILDGRDSSTWIDVALHGAVERIQAGRQSESMVVGVLRDGVVPAGGFLYDTAGPVPASGRWSEIAGVETSVPPPVPSPQIESHPEVPAPPAPAATEPTPSVMTPVAEDVADLSGEDSSGSDPTESETDEGRTATALAGMFARIDERYRRDDSAEPFSEEQEEPAHGPESTLTAYDQDEEFAPQPETAPSNGSPTPTFPPVPTSDHTPTRPNTGTLAPVRPQLRGILCPDGHLTSTDGSTCRTCGLVTDPDAQIVTGDRPVLGVLTFDDGAILPVDRPAAIGSNVPPGYEIDGEPATVVKLDDGLGGVSPVQVEIRTVGWDVEIHDMNSENGTYTILLGERQTRTRLRAGQSVMLQQEMMVEVGSRHFTYTVGATPSSNDS